MNISWDAQKYTNDFSFVHEYGNSVMELIDFDNVKNAVDLGCGNGALTKKLKNELYTDGDWYADYVRLRMKAVKAD